MENAIMERRQEHDDDSGQPNDMSVSNSQRACQLGTLEEDSLDYVAKTGSSPRTLTTLSKIADELQSAAPAISNVAVTNSENVQFGNNTYFNGPVVIRQIIQSNAGLDNVAFTKSENEDLQNNTLSPTTPSKCDSTATRFHIKTWHKVIIIMASVVIVSVACSLALTGSNTKTTSNTPRTKGQQQCFDDTVTGFSSFYLGALIFTSVVAVYIIIYFIPYSLNQRCLGGCKHITQNKARRKFSKGSPSEALLVAKHHLRWVTRNDWLAQPPSGDLEPIVTPVPWVILAHTATESCFNQSECVLRTRIIQQFHVESKRWFDIGYNFLIGGDGSVYVGRGWDYVGAHTKSYNQYSIGMAFIGSFNTETPTELQFQAFEKVLRVGVELGKLDKHYKLFAHRQLWATSSPGDKVYDVIKNWPHFVTNTTGVFDNLPEFKTS